LVWGEGERGGSPRKKGETVAPTGKEWLGLGHRNQSEGRGKKEKKKRSPNGRRTERSKARFPRTQMEGRDYNKKQCVIYKERARKGSSANRNELGKKLR